MAEEKILLKAEFDADAAEKKAISLRQQLDATKVANKELNESFKQGTITQEEYSKAIYLNEKSQKDLSRQIGVVNRDISLAEKFNKSNGTSLNALSAQYRLLVDQIRDLSEEEREQTEAGKKLVAQAAELSEKLKEQEKAYGNAKRSVGDYIKDVNILGVNVGQASDSLKEGFQGFQTFTKGITLSRGALTALTAVPIVLFLVGLISFLKTTDAGADKLEQGIAALKSALTVFTKGLVTFKEFGEGIFDALVKGAGALYDILFSFDSEKILKGIDNLGGAYNDVKASTDKAATSFGNLTGEAYRAALAQIELTKATQDLGDAQDDLIEKNALAEAAVSKALLTAKDRSKSEQERIKLLAAAGNLEKENSKEQLRIKEELYRVTILQNLNELNNRKETIDELNKLSTDQLRAVADRYRAEGALQDEAYKSIREASADRIKLESETADKLQQIDNRTAALADEFQKERLAKLKKLEEERKKLEEARAKAAQDYLNRTKAEYDETTKLTNDFYAQQETALLESLQAGQIKQSEFDDKLTELKLSQLKRQLQDAQDYGRLTAELEKKIAQESLRIVQEGFDKRFAAISKKINREKSLNETIYNDTLKGIQEAYSQQNLIISQQQLNQTVTEQEAQRARLENEKHALQRQFDEASKNGKDTVALQTELTNKLIEIKKFERDSELAVQQAKFDALSSIGGALMELNRLVAGSNADSTEFGKALAVFQIAISTASAIAKGIAAASDVPFPGNLIAIATTVATVAANIAQAQSILSSAGDAPKPAFYEGGYTSPGNPREEATNLGPKPYTYHKDEYVVPSKVLHHPAGAAMVANLERIRRANPGMMGLSGMADGGFTARSIQANAGVDMDALKNVVVSAVAAQKAPIVRVTDINKVSASAKSSVAKATL